MSYDTVDVDVVSSEQRIRQLELELERQRQKLRTVKAALKMSLKPLVEERASSGFEGTASQGWKRPVSEKMEARIPVSADVEGTQSRRR